ncbi:PAS domain S-box-containing protein [Winogradskyella epiphytica]|uniref:histidine kinase n=1 Tax=Winogradskyella epiphytica TaxID=262005 RepID=A0A2V4Y1J3_9FLAO|nr:HAMP domain-containing sensor histidine kinase [Winogradskyella epiphytica]PYE82684.1 PAS domain S-box-containing protein [Winogradskyella epiphytica]GGW72678.1 hypothetical protein GCM10008085_26270 [Winogradskyella epiphytica]
MPKNLKRLRNQLFESIFNNAHGGISIISPEGIWIKVNKSIENLLGYKESELIGTNFKDITHRDDLELDVEHMQELLDGTLENYQIEKRYFHKNGSVVWVLLSVSLVRDETDSPIYFISQMTDISVHKSASGRLDFLMNVVNEQNEKLKDFAHIATHDIRTHVGNLFSITEFLEEDFEEVLSSNENFKMLKESLANLNDTINNLSSIRENKKRSFKKLKRLSLHKYVESAIYNVSAIAKKEKCQIINNVNKGVKIQGIEAYLDSIILNFLTNSIKYKSDKRLPVIELSSEIDNEYVVLKIKDNGLGMDLEKSYDKLFTLNGILHKHHDSRGIGLYITKNNVENIGGKIEVESVVDEGTVFSTYFLKAEPISQGDHRVRFA